MREEEARTDGDLVDGPAAAVFAVLADRNRRRIIERIVSKGPATATALSRELGITRQGAAKHLVSMARAGVLTSTKTGAEVRYRLLPDAFEAGSDWLGLVTRRWSLRSEADRQVEDD